MPTRDHPPSPVSVPSSLSLRPVGLFRFTVPTYLEESALPVCPALSHLSVAPPTQAAKPTAHVQAVQEVRTTSEEIAFRI
jgi:hypothetical protein